MAGEQLRELYEGVTQDYAIFSVDPNGFIMTWNDGAARMKQYTAEEAIGNHFSMLYPKEARERDEPMEHLRQAAREGRFRGEGVRLRKSGQLFLADVQITPIYRDGKLIGFSKVVADVTEQGRLRNEREEEIHTLRAEREIRERFVSALTHDLRNPLTAAKMALQLAANDPRIPGESAGLLAISLRNLNRIDQMISDLLDASRIRAGVKPPLRIEKCDLIRIVDEARQEFRMVYGDRFKLKADAPVVGFWDPNALKRVVENLLSNAVKHGDLDKPITIACQTTGDDRLLLKIHNFGPAIPYSEQRRLFQPFQQSRSAQANVKKGWGLGLTLVRGLVEAHGGSVTVESTPEEATTFTVTLPKDARRCQQGLKAG